MVAMPLDHQTNSASQSNSFVPGLDPVRGVFVSKKGVEIELTRNPINTFLIERLQNEGKPTIPKISVTIGGKYTQLENNPNDANYQAALKEWQSEAGIRVAKYCFNAGVKGQPPSEFVEEQREYFPNATKHDLKYLWVTSLIPDEDDIAKLAEVIIGASEPTEGGMLIVAESFRG